MTDQRIRVEFVDAATNNIFAATESVADSLPETFVLNTSVNIGGQEWQVDKADPMTRAEYIQTGKLTLTLSKIVMMPVKDILYSLPTLYNALPAMEERSVAPDKLFGMNADLWRCVEFVPKSQQSIIDKEFQMIAIIYADHREGQGFNKLHVRTSPEAPLAGLLRLTELKALFPSADVFETIAFHREFGVAKDVFAIGYGTWVLYGEHRGGAIQTLALEPRSEHEAEPLDPILQLMRIYDLLLVDWINANAMPYQEANLYLKRFQTQ
jgi:hypothetical protein